MSRTLGAGLRHVHATRYLTPLREGGSLPGLLEGDDLGTYVVKFRGAGHGSLALVAEVVVGELARGLGLAVPELVLVELDGRLAPAEPDQEVQDLLRASAGLNLGVDFLPGSLGLTVGADPVDPAWAAQVLWLDVFTLNVDRSWRNPNLLVWHGRPYLIDHGAALVFQHRWSAAATDPRRPLPGVTDHVLLPVAGSMWAAHEAVSDAVPDALDAALAAVPPPWLDQPAQRYQTVLLDRLAAAERWLAATEVARVDAA
jgi:hypothetical protein